jgi:hypothetical protein
MARTALKPLGKPAPQAPQAAPSPAAETNPATRPAKVGLRPLNRAPEPAPAPAQEVVQTGYLHVVDVEPVSPAAAEAVQEASPVLDEAPAPSQAIVPAQSQAIVPASSTPAFQLGKTVGHVESSDLYRPRLNLVQNASNKLLEAGCPLGSIVLAGEAVIWDKDYPALNLIGLASRKEFVEDVDFDKGEVGRVFQSPAEVKAAGLWTEWQGDEPPPVYPRLTVVVLIERPDYVDDETGLFGIEIGEKLYALAEVQWSGSGYTAAAKTYLTAEKGVLARGTHHGRWSYSAIRRQNKNGTTSTVPVLKFAGFNEPDFVKAIEDLAW